MLNWSHELNLSFSESILNNHRKLSPKFRLQPNECEFKLFQPQKCQSSRRKVLSVSRSTSRTLVQRESTLTVHREKSLSKLVGVNTMVLQYHVVRFILLNSHSRVMSPLSRQTKLSTLRRRQINSINAPLSIKWCLADRF